MNKQLKLLAAAAALAFGSANAATLGPTNFNVTVNLTASCSMTAPADVAFTYTSFGGAATSTGGGFTVTCTNSLPYTLALDATSGTVIGLNYTLALAPGGTGNGAAQSYTIAGNMVAGQSGTCAAPVAGVCSGSQVRTLTVTY
jgi:spore coat protein U-like protein